MSNTSYWRVAADVPEKVRPFLLRHFVPSFSNVQCRTLTFAYRVPQDLRFPTGRLKVSIYGHHKADTHEALLVRVNGQTFRPDGFRYFIGLSIAAGEEPARCGEIDSDSITMLDREIHIDKMKFQLFPLWNRNAETKKAA